MALLPSAFNPNDPAQQGVGDWTPLPKADYYAQVIATDIEANSKQTGTFIKCDWFILAGEHAGKTLITRLNIQNPNPQAVEIAQKHMKSMCDAMGIVGPVMDTVEYHNKPCIISVKVTPGDAQYGPGNDITKYAPTGEQPVVAAVATPGVVPAAVPIATPGVVVPDWGAAAGIPPVAAPPVAPAAAPVAVPAVVPAVAPVAVPVATPVAPAAIPAAPVVPVVPTDPNLVAPVGAPVVPAVPVETPVEAAKVAPWLKPK